MRGPCKYRGRVWEDARLCGLPRKESRIIRGGIAFTRLPLRALGLAGGVVQLAMHLAQLHLQRRRLLRRLGPPRTGHTATTTAAATATTRLEPPLEVVAIALRRLLLGDQQSHLLLCSQRGRAVRTRE